MQYNPNTVDTIHIELTDRCQAACPMCARNFNGGETRPELGFHEITLEQFQRWFPADYLANITDFYLDGNFGDPIMAKDCLEIVKYINSFNIHTHIYTNGSARSTAWWAELAQHTTKVVFAIDGYEDAHVLYRRGTDWNKIIDNAKAFITAGGRAEIDCLVFAHNEHTIEQFRTEMLALGFAGVTIKSTRRFFGLDRYPVHNKDNELEGYLDPAQKDEWKVVHKVDLSKLKNNPHLLQSQAIGATIAPTCVKKNEIYVDGWGRVMPCAWVGSDLAMEPNVLDSDLQQIQNYIADNTRTQFSKFNTTLDNEPMTAKLWDELVSKWQSAEPPWICVKNCCDKSVRAKINHS